MEGMGCVYRILTGLKDILLGNEELIEAFATEFKAELARLRKRRGIIERQTQKGLNKVNTSIRAPLRIGELPEDIV